MKLWRWKVQKPVSCKEVFIVVLFCIPAMTYYLHCTVLHLDLNKVIFYSYLKLTKTNIMYKDHLGDNITNSLSIFTFRGGSLARGAFSSFSGAGGWRRRKWWRGRGGGDGRGVRGNGAPPGGAAAGRATRRGVRWQGLEHAAAALLDRMLEKRHRQILLKKSSIRFPFMTKVVKRSN